MDVHGLTLKHEIVVSAVHTIDKLYKGKIYVCVREHV